MFWLADYVEWILEFDGVDDSMLLPYYENIRAITMWVNIYSTQLLDQVFLFDARFNSAVFQLDSRPQLFLSNRYACCAGLFQKSLITPRHVVS